MRHMDSVCPSLAHPANGTDNPSRRLRRMDRIERLLDALAPRARGGYRPDGPVATEPTALAALALLAHGRRDRAGGPLDWLLRQQGRDGGLGVAADQPSPCWPTGWAVLAWLAAQEVAPSVEFSAAIRSGVTWITTARGEALPRNEFLAHDSTLVGWPWVDQTHSWVEPTAIQVLALKRAGHAGHARTREGVRLLLDRCLPHGGWNYGNTVVLGQELRPHVMPTGLALLALADEMPTDEMLSDRKPTDDRIDRSLDFLRRELPRCRATASFSLGLMGLAAHDALPTTADAWWGAMADRTIGQKWATFPLALLALAALPAERNPLFVRREEVTA
jgi:hypothetical protein